MSALLLLGEVHAEQIPTLEGIVENMSIIYRSKQHELGEKHQQHIKAIQNAKSDSEKQDAKKKLEQFMAEVSGNKQSMARIQQFLAGAERLKDPATKPSGENYQKLQRYHYLRNLLYAGDLWVSVAENTRDSQGDKSSLLVSWQKQKSILNKELETLMNEPFVKAGAMTWVEEKKDGEKPVVIAQGRAIRRALAKRGQPTLTVPDNSQRSFREMDDERNSQ